MEELLALIAKKRTSVAALEQSLKAFEDNEDPARLAIEVALNDLNDEINELEFQRMAKEDESFAVDESPEFLAKAAEVGKSKGLPDVIGQHIKYVSKSVVYPGNRSKSELSSTKARTKYPRKADDYRPSPEQLSKIQNVTNVDLKAEQIYVFTAKAADQKLDRSKDMFRPKALQSGAKMLPDKPIQKDHNMSVDDSVGKSYEGSVYKQALWNDFFILDTPENKSFLDKVFAGIVNKMSVHFSMRPQDYVCSSCSKSLYSMECKHYPGMIDEKGNEVFAYIMDVKDFYENSFVVAPAQPEAGVRRNELSVSESEKSNNSNVVDKIPDVKTNGDLPVTEEEKAKAEAAEAKAAEEAAAVEQAKKDAEAKAAAEKAAAEAKALEAPKPEDVVPPTSTEKKVETPAAPAPQTDVVAELSAKIDALTASLKASVENTNAVLKALIDASNTQSQLLSKVASAPAEKSLPLQVTLEEPTANKGMFGHILSNLPKAD